MISNNKKIKTLKISFIFIKINDQNPIIKATDKIVYNTIWISNPLSVKNECAETINTLYATNSVQIAEKIMYRILNINIKKVFMIFYFLKSQDLLFSSHFQWFFKQYSLFITSLPNLNPSAQIPISAQVS